MLLKRNEENNTIKSIFDSSNIIASKYDKTKYELEIIFKHGGKYLYENVMSSDFLRFETAESQGSVFNNIIKSKTTKKLDSVDPTPIINLIENIKKEEKKLKIEQIQNKITIIINDLIKINEIKDYKKLLIMTNELETEIKKIQHEQLRQSI